MSIPPFHDTIGHEREIQRLQRLVKNDRVPQAMLFFGPEGIGKHRVATTLAATLLCSDTRDGEHCGRCRSCRALESLTHPDFYEIVPEKSGKASRTIKIEKIREVQGALARIPRLSKKSVLIVDDAHLMNQSASNALLKTLEEPAGDVVFILVTHSREAILSTVTSRCMLLPFVPLGDESLRSLLAERGIDSDTAKKILPLAGGSLGRALTLASGDMASIRSDAARIIAGLKNMSTDEAFAEGERLGAMEREMLAEWLRNFRELMIGVISIYGGATAGSEARAFLPWLGEGRAFRLLELSGEAERRLLTSNAATRILMEAFLIRAADTK